MRYPKLRELKEAVKALIRGPYTSKFPKARHEPFPRFRGRPYFHEEDCIGCTACAQVCPVKAIEYEDVLTSSGAKRILTVQWDVCIFCGQCQANCVTSKGIMLSREFDFATTENRKALRQTIEKEMVVCECCGEPIAPYDQFAWVAAKLGPLCFTNSSLLLFYFKTLDIAVGQPVRGKADQPDRGDRVRIICPSCRRKAVLQS